MDFSLVSLLLCFFRKLASILVMSLCYSYCGVIWPVLARPLLGLLYAFLSLDYSDPALSFGLHSCYLGFLDPYHCLRASLTHFFLLEHLWSIFFPWTSSAHSNYAFPWVFAISFGLPQPNYHILCLWDSWAFHQPLTHLLHHFGPPRPILTFILPIGLLLLSPGSFKPTCFLWGPFLILWVYNPLFLSFRFNGFSLNLLTLFCSYCWISSRYWTFPKRASTKGKLQITNLKFESIWILHLKVSEFEIYTITFGDI